MGHGTVCLSFDFDAVSGWLWSPTPTPVSRGEFSVVAVPRVLNLLAARGLASTWFIPGHTLATYPEACREIVSAGHEVALHGYAHERGSSLTLRQEREIFRRAFDLAASLAGSAPRGSRAPSWDLTPHTLDIMEELGLWYDSSLMGHDYRPYYCRKGDRLSPEGPVVFGPPTQVVELPVSWSLDDWPHFEFGATTQGVLPGLRRSEDVFANWTDDLRYMVRDFTDGVVVITMHPEVIGRGHRLLGLERWLDGLAELDLTFARMDHVAEQFRAGRDYGRYTPAQGPYRSP